MSTSIEASPAQGVKCPRCWHMHGVRLNHDGLCDRCCAAIVEGWPGHSSVPHIVAAQAAQRARFAPHLLQDEAGRGARELSKWLSAKP